MEPNIAVAADAPVLHGAVSISNAEYHDGPGISKSALDVITRSPRHYWDRYINPDREPREETAAMKLGSATHTAVLEPDDFPNRYIVLPEDAPRRPTSAQLNAKNPSAQTLLDIEWWEDFDKENASRTILKPDEYALCIAMRDAVHTHPVAGPLFANGISEQAYYVTAPVETIDHETGEIIVTNELLKCKPDFRTANNMIIDLKKTTDASPGGFARSVGNYRYYVQAPYYLDIIERIEGEPPQWFIFVAIEETRPFSIGVYYVEADDLAFGRRRYMKDLQRIVECKRLNEWPDYAAQIEALRLPKWIQNVD